MIWRLVTRYKIIYNMAKDPAFLFYSSDFLSGTFTMSNEQLGKYIRLLCLQHQKGLLSEKDLLNICGTYDEDIFNKFQKKEGLFYNVRLLEESDKRKKFSESRRNNRNGVKSLTSDKDMIDICATLVPHMENENENIIKDIIEEKKELSEIEIEYQITQMIVPNILKVWKDKNPKYFSHLQTDSHAALQIACNIASAKSWKKAQILNGKEIECIASFTKIAEFIMEHKFWSSKTLEQISRPNNWQKIVNEMTKRTQQPIAELAAPTKPRYDIHEQLKTYN